MHRTNVKVSTHVKVRTNVKVRTGEVLLHCKSSVRQIKDRSSSNVPTDLYFAGASIKNSINFSKRNLVGTK